jgi:UDP-N-acetylmuramoyl-tripeptide--D-alanyl-D-alanine ligase
MKAFFKAVVVMILTAEAAFLLKRKKPKIVAVTGSVGKTTTKDAVFAAIKNNAYSRKSEKSFNSEIGIPLTILGLPNAWNNPLAWLRNIVEGFFIAFFSRSYPEVLVLEAGIDRPGDMQRLTRWLKPDIVVLTKLPDIPVHVEYFSSPAEVVEEKMKLVTALKPDGVFIYNNDDTIIAAQLESVMQKKIGFGRETDTDFTARMDRVVYQDDQPVGTEFVLHHCGNEHVIFIGDTVGMQYTYACSAAVAVADELSVPIDAAVTSLQSFRTPNGRMRLLPGMKSTLIIDDTYNASPVATEYALLALQELTYAKRKIVVLGDMLELGKYSTDEHRRIGSLVPKAAQVLFTVGVRAQMIAEGAMAAGMSEKHIFQYDDAARAGRELQAILTHGDVVLVKASQGVRAERIVEEIMANPEQAEELLVRQEKAWRSIA